ncbi:MAG TPA: hypothetical protein VMY76_02865, partial [Gemmatimonadales bacterium]|nr:hypothetical protein [Gemmatimonadales bacterium]
RTDGLAAGSHTVSLSGVAANCAVTGEPGLTVQVSANAVATASFAVVCGATTSTIQVTTVSTGSPVDPDGYELLLDGGGAQPIAANAAVTIASVAPGTHTVQLEGIATNCALEGDNPRTVTTTAAATLTVTLTVNCSPPTPPPAPGSISVTTETSGPGQDADGYAVTLDGGAGLPIGGDATLPLPDLAAGQHSVGLAGIAANCSLEGDNPRVVTVSAGTVAQVAFAVTCDALPPATGTLEIVTATTGSDLDPSGYTFVLDGDESQAIGVNATVSVSGLRVGSHTVRLRAVATNCTVGGDNPRSVSIDAGATAQVAFSVTCAAATGALQVTTATTGAPVDADGYTVSVDGGTAGPIGTGASVAFEALAPGAHAVLLAGLAANCRVQGQNPREVTIVAGETAVAAFTIVCTATTGSLAITVAGLPAGVDAAVTVTGPGGFSEAVTATRTLTGLAPGDYTVTAAGVTTGGTTYTASPASRTVTVVAAETEDLTVTYGPAAGPSLNLRIDSWYLSQSVQSPEGDVPFVNNRDGYLRLFVVANEANTVAPSVRVRVFRNGALTRTLTVPAPVSSTPTSKDEEDLARSWNVKIPRELIGPGFAVLADVDPANAIPEKNETDNTFPVSAAPRAPVVRSVPVLGVRFVPVKQRVSGLQGDVTNANRSGYLDLARRMYPMAGTDGDVHAVYTTATSDGLQPGDANGAWLSILGEIDALRVAEGTGRNYYGVVRIDYTSGIAGLGYIGLPTAIGYDHPTDGPRVMAHELGHNWGRLHAPCGSPADADVNYPYVGGAIGVFGVDMQVEALKPPFTPDIMGYCGNPWISDYTYEGVLAYRAGAQAAMAAAASQASQRCLLVWGRIVNGRPVLEPAFEIVTRPSLPKRPGAYSVEGAAGDGSPVFAISFDASAVIDGQNEARQFAFAVPLADGMADRIGRLRLTSPSGEVAAARVAASSSAARSGAEVEARAAGDGVTLRWDAAAHPMLMVRDPETGEVLSFARGGTAEIATGKAELEVVLSDRVGSRTLRVPVAR